MRAFQDICQLQRSIELLSSQPVESEGRSYIIIRIAGEGQPQQVLLHSMIWTTQQTWSLNLTGAFQDIYQLQRSIELLSSQPVESKGRSYIIIRIAGEGQPQQVLLHSMIWTTQQTWSLNLTGVPLEDKLSHI